MASNSDGSGLLWLALGLLALHQCTKEPEGTEELVSEYGMPEDEAAEMIEAYGSVDDARDAYEAGEERPTYYGDYSESEEIYRAPFDEIAARRQAEDELANEGYDGRYGCTIDCSGHDAGWEWRADHGYSTPGRSNSFDEGSRAFDEALDERVEAMRQDHEMGLEPDY